MSNGSRASNNKGATLLAIYPRACVWIVRHTLWANGGHYRYEAYVFEYDNGLTELEAWKKADIRYDGASPAVPFHECVLIPVTPWPYPNVTEVRSKVVQSKEG